MARPLRIEYSGALYHITSRGDGREDIVESDDDRQLFFEVLAQVIDRYEWVCHGYCLMDNHYHLVIETPHPNLSKGMRHLNGVYTQRYNALHGRVGHVYQGRYKAILVDKDSYLLELCRYVVLNPVRAKMVKKAEHWPWSSYRATVGKTPVPDYLTIDWVLGQFGKQLKATQRKYAEFVESGYRAESVWRALRQQIYLGEEGFIKKQLKKVERDRSLKEIPRAQRKTSAKPLSYYSSRYDEKRGMAKAYLTGLYSQREIAEYYRVHYSTVSRAIKALGQQIRQCKT